MNTETNILLETLNILRNATPLLGPVDNDNARTVTAVLCVQAQKIEDFLKVQSLMIGNSQGKLPPYEHTSIRVEPWTIWSGGDSTVHYSTERAIHGAIRDAETFFQSQP